MKDHYLLQVAWGHTFWLYMKAKMATTCET